MEEHPVTGAEKSAEVSRIEALSTLVQTAPRELLAKQSAGGKRLLQHIYEQCCTSGLVPDPTAEDDVQRLHGLFSIAQQQCLPAIIVDYVVEVCSNETLTSSDPVEALLLDGECVSQWLTAALDASQLRLEASLSSSLQEDRGQGVTEELGCIAGLLPVSYALEPLAEGKRGTKLQKAAQLHQCAKVIAWCRQQNLHQTSSSGRYSSRQEWAMVGRKRQAACFGTTFLQDHLDDLAELQGSMLSFLYPPESIGKAIGSLFLSGHTADSTSESRLKVFLYYLLDCGHSSVLPSFGAAFGFTAQELDQQHAYFLLDESLLDQPGNLALETACSILPEVATSSMPFKVVEVLAARGKQATALKICDSCGRGTAIDPEVALHTTLVAVAIMLDCGRPSKALAEISKHCSDLPPERKIVETDALMHCLAEWAQESSCLSEIIKLPLQEQQEKALLNWLREQSGKGNDDAGTVLILYYLQRQRYAEASHAYKLLQPVSASASKSGQARKAVTRLLQAATHLLPNAQKQLVVSSQLSATPSLDIAERGLGINGTSSHGLTQALPQGSSLYVTGPCLDELPLLRPLCNALQSTDENVLPEKNGGFEEGIFINGLSENRNLLSNSTLHSATARQRLLF